MQHTQSEPGSLSVGFESRERIPSAAIQGVVVYDLGMCFFVLGFLPYFGDCIRSLVPITTMIIMTDLF